MKKIAIIIVSLAFSVMNVSAQTNTDSINKPVRSISAELFGPSNLIGIHYDSRFKGNKGWGYSIGAAWGYMQKQYYFYDMDHFHIISVVPRVNYLIGRKNHKIELGLGSNLGFVMGKEEYLLYQDQGKYKLIFKGLVKEKHEFFAYYFFGNIGYRHQTRRGFMFRAGVTPMFGFGGKHSMEGIYIAPYLSFGKSF